MTVGPPRASEPRAPWPDILEFFDIGALVGTPTPVVGGWSHSVWRVDSHQGVFAVKEMVEMPGAWWIEQLEAATAFEMAAWEAHAVPMPEPITARESGGLLARLGTPEAARLVYRCHRWVEGRPCVDDTADVARSATAGELIAALAGLYMHGGTTADQLQWNALDAFDDTVAEARSMSVDWAELLAGLKPLVSELRSDYCALAERALPMVVCHRDVDPKNVLIDRPGRLVLTDWDYAGPRLLASELLAVAISFAGGTFHRDEDCVFAAVDAYRLAEGPHLSFENAAPTMIEEGFRWIMLNAWRALGHRGVTTEEAAFAASVVRKQAQTWPASVAAARLWSKRLTDRT